MGKQIMAFPAREGRTNDVYFEQCHHWIDDGAQYRDKLQYRNDQPEKKKGFLPGDFKRRDEFSSDFRTRQYREQLQGEAKHARKMVQMINAQVKGTGGGYSSGRAQGEDVPLRRRVRGLRHEVVGLQQGGAGHVQPDSSGVQQGLRDDADHLADAAPAPDRVRQAPVRPQAGRQGYVLPEDQRVSEHEGVRQPSVKKNTAVRSEASLAACTRKSCNEN